MTDWHSSVSDRHAKMATSNRPRPLSDQGPAFSRARGEKSEPKDCIWITPDILNEFRTQVLRSHKVNIDFDTPWKYLGRTHFKLPPLYRERLKQLRVRAARTVGQRNASGSKVKQQRLSRMTMAGYDKEYVYTSQYGFEQWDANLVGRLGYQE